MDVSYIDHMGSDLTVVNAARVSFDKHKTSEEANWNDEPGSDYRLVKYLATNAHWTPFAHPTIQLRMTAPVCIRTQCFKHKQGFVENEISRRYVDEAPEFFMPETWRGRPVNGAKQGSSDTVITELIHTEQDKEFNQDFSPAFFVAMHNEASLNMYEWLLASGVAPEQARMVLPQSMETSWYWTGSLAAYARFYKQRTDPHAQKEIQDLAAMVGDIIRPLFPVCWEALTK